MDGKWRKPLRARNMEHLVKLYRESKATDYEEILHWVYKQGDHKTIWKFVFLSYMCQGGNVFKNAVKICQEVVAIEDMG